LTETHAQQGVFHSKSKQWTWKQLARSSASLEKNSVPYREAVAAYDSHRKILVCHHGGNQRRGEMTPKRTWHYDVDAGRWRLVRQSSEGPIGHDAYGLMVYDAHARACFIVG
jgi:hypothetical protein